MEQDLETGEEPSHAIDLFIDPSKDADQRRVLSPAQEDSLALQIALQNEPINGRALGLCGMCQKINLHSRYGFGHFRYKSLVKSANLGCPLCKLFLDNIQRVALFCSADLTVDLAKNAIMYKYAGYPPGVFEFFSSEGCKGELDRNIFLREVHSDPMSDGCLTVAQNWLKNCISGHARCKQDLNAPPPTRLLQISGNKIVLREHLPKHREYAILSHCWGNGVKFITTGATLAARKEEISFENLPNVFQDTITLARKFGLTYLWIDSLCIIQDSTKDWQAECVRMGNYYRNAFVTISALDSRSDDEGFLHARDTAPAVIISEENQIYVRPSVQSRRKIFEEAALCKRGWTLQERLLSTRVLHYSRSEMFWECQTCSARESSAREHRDQIDSRSVVFAEGDDFKRILLHIDAEGEANGEDAFSIWYRLVKQFSARKLTHFEDKLPAISAMAAAFAAVTSYEYMAGLWKQDVCGLLWVKRVVDGVTRPQPQEYSPYYGYPVDAEHYRAPSWSWAAVDDVVVFPFFEERCQKSSNDAVILQSTIHPKGLDKFGEVVNGSLHLRARSKPVQLCVSVFSRLRRAPRENIDTCYSMEAAYRFWDATAEYHSLDDHRYDMEIYDLNGLRFASGTADDELLKLDLKYCTAIWISEYIYDGKRANRARYFILVIPELEGSRKWRRVGMGVTRRALDDVSDDDKDWQWNDFMII